MKITLTTAGKRFNREWIFRNFNYHFFSGKKYAITGANGSGKSTLLQTLSGSITLNEGNINWQQNDIAIQSEKIYSYQAIAAPYFELIEEMTAKEFLLFHCKFKPLVKTISIDKILVEASLINAANKQIRFFSSGMKQRLKLAQAFFSDVPLLLLDEPCTNLDVSGINLYYNWIEKYSAERLIIISSNDRNEYNFCDEEINLQSIQKQKTTV